MGFIPGNTMSSVLKMTCDITHETSGYTDKLEFRKVICKLYQIFSDVLHFHLTDLQNLLRNERSDALSHVRVFEAQAPIYSFHTIAKNNSKRCVLKKKSTCAFTTKIISDHNE